MSRKYKRISRNHDEIDKKIYEITNTITQLTEDVKWIKCMIKKFDNRIWAVLILLVSTILSSIFISIFR